MKSYTVHLNEAAQTGIRMIRRKFKHETYSSIAMAVSANVLVPRHRRGLALMHESIAEWRYRINTLRIGVQCCLPGCRFCQYRPLISIVMPVFNSRWLDEAVASVLKQSYDNYELILIDDGSSNPASLPRSNAPPLNHMFVWSTPHAILASAPPTPASLGPRRV